jgi:hypothetical protein
MPENLTEFAIRAIGISGYNKFGTAKSKLAVRLPVIVQSALPRFVRPGDTFLAGGIGRIVEGDGGDGSIAVESEGMYINDPGNNTYSRNIFWEPDRPERIYVPFGVPSGFSPEKNTVTVRMAVERERDGVSDGFEIKLPIQYDTEQRIIDRFVQLEPLSPVNLPLPKEKIRENTLKQKILITTEPELLKLVTALQFLTKYEYGCTEQQVSKLYPAVALKDFLTAFNLSSWYAPDTDQFASLFSYLDSALTEEGLYSYWPGSDGYVSLTSYIVEFLSRAKAAGIEFDENLINTPKQALIEALRSDYGRFVPGHKMRERIEALAALNTVGHYDPGYAQDLLAGAFQAGLYTKSKIVSVLLERESESQTGVQQLLDEIKDSLVFKLRDGEEVFAGIDYVPEAYGGLVLTGNIKAISSATKTLALADRSDRRVGLLIDYLLEQADSDGWGNTQENVQALLALKEAVTLTPESGTVYRFNLTTGGTIREILLENKALTSVELGTEERTERTEERTLTYMAGLDGPEGSDQEGAGPDTPLPYVWLVTEYVPDIPGDKIIPLQEGFVVEREHHFYSANGVLRERIPIKPGGIITYQMDDIIEEHVTVINPEERNFIAITVPIASGFEPMNPDLATSPPEASPRGRLTLQPSYTKYEDDKVQFFYDTLPKGQYEFYFRVRAGFEGSFVQPPAESQMMYDLRIKGRSGGTRIQIGPKR